MYSEYLSILIDIKIWNHIIYIARCDFLNHVKQYLVINFYMLK